MFDLRSAFLYIENLMVTFFSPSHLLAVFEYYCIECHSEVLHKYTLVSHPQVHCRPTLPHSSIWKRWRLLVLAYPTLTIGMHYNIAYANVSYWNRRSITQKIFTYEFQIWAFHYEAFLSSWLLDDTVPEHFQNV